MCTIALAKVQRNYNCYNVYFYECLLRNPAVSWVRYEKSRSVKRRYSESAMNGTLGALLSVAG